MLKEDWLDSGTSNNCRNAESVFADTRFVNLKSYKIGNFGKSWIWNGYFHGYQTNGIFQTQEEIDNAAVFQEDAQPGDLIFVDQDGDGIINFNDDSDKTIGKSCR